jgi:hypothetical protein
MPYASHRQVTMKFFDVRYSPILRRLLQGASCSVILPRPRTLEELQEHTRQAKVRWERLRREDENGRLFDEPLVLDGCRRLTKADLHQAREDYLATRRLLRMVRKYQA